MRRNKGPDSEHFTLLISEKSLKRQSKLRSTGIEELEDLKYRLGRSVAKERWSKITIMYSSEQILSVRPDVDKYR